VLIASILCPFVHQPNPGEVSLLAAGCHGCPIGLRPRPGNHRPLGSSRSLRHEMAEAAGKSKQDEHTAVANLSETPEKQKKIYMTHSLS
jgi:hypothetical protein